MRAYSWIALGGVALACSGSVFTAKTTDPSGDGGDGDGDISDGGSGGTLNRAGRGSGGSLVGDGGKIGKGGTGSGGSTAGGTSSSGGVTGIAGNPGSGGDLVIGGSVSTAGTTSGAGTGGTSPDPIDKVCPKLQPNPGAACVDGLVCSYGTDVRTACRPVAKCANGVWGINKPVCEQLHGCNDVIAGKACDAGSAKPCLQNPTDGGVYCTCTGCSGGAGACSPQTVWVWACVGGSGGPACPKLPPNEGQMCSGATQCGYGSCATGNGVTTACDGSTWSWDGVVCPL